MFSVPLQRGENLGKFVRILDLLSNSPKRSPRFSPGYEETEEHVLFLKEILLVH